MSNRYTNRTLVKNSNEQYEELFEGRGVDFITQYGSAELQSPTVSQRTALTRVRHIWKVGDRYYKLAMQHYGSAEYWWVIALYNRKPTEANLKVGDVLIIPLPLDKVLRMIG